MGCENDTVICSFIKRCLVDQIVYCSNLDKKWKKTENRKQKTEVVEFEMNQFISLHIP